MYIQYVCFTCTYTLFGSIMLPFPCSIPMLHSHVPFQLEVQERTQQYLAIQEGSEHQQRMTNELVQTLVQKIGDISDVFGSDHSNSKLPDVSFIGNRNWNLVKVI